MRLSTAFPLSSSKRSWPRKAQGRLVPQLRPPHRRLCSGKGESIVCDGEEPTKVDDYQLSDVIFAREVTLLFKHHSKHHKSSAMGC